MVVERSVLTEINEDVMLCYHPQVRRGSVLGALCLSVCNAVTVENLHPESSFSVICRYTFRISKSSLCIKVDRVKVSDS